MFRTVYPETQWSKNYVGNLVQLLLLQLRLLSLSLTKHSCLPVRSAATTAIAYAPALTQLSTVMLAAYLVQLLRIRIHRIHVFLGLQDPDPDPLVRGMDPDPSVIMQK
jgi:hypothetical protein